MNIHTKKKVILGIGTVVLAVLIGVIFLRDATLLEKIDPLPDEVLQKDPLFEHNLDEALQAIEALEELELE